MFVVLMLMGGVVPCCLLAIKRIKLQGRNQDYNTDDFIALSDAPGSGAAKLLAQIKHRISLREGDSAFAEVIKAALASQVISNHSIRKMIRCFMNPLV
jgi:hypothetical protein